MPSKEIGYGFIPQEEMRACSPYLLFPELKSTARLPEAQGISLKMECFSEKNICPADVSNQEEIVYSQDNQQLLRELTVMDLKNQGSYW